MSRAIVEQVLSDHAGHTIAPNGEQFETRRRSLLVPLIDQLPGGRGRWGILKKTGSVPSDVVVDLNMDHYDVFSGTDLNNGTSRITANWQNKGDFRKVAARWRRATVAEALAEGWIEPLPGVEPEPSTPDPEPPPGQVPDVAELWAHVRALEARCDRHLKD